MSGTAQNANEPQGEDGLVVHASAADVFVDKAIEPVTDDLWQIQFRVDTLREARTDVRIVDSLPDGFPCERVGFHEDYDRENWSLEDESRVVHETTIDGEAPFETAYAVRPTDDLSVETFSDEPDLDVVDGTERETDADATTEMTTTNTHDEGTTGNATQGETTGAPSDEELADLIDRAEREAEKAAAEAVEDEADRENPEVAGASFDYPADAGSTSGVEVETDAEVEAEADTETEADAGTETELDTETAADTDTGADEDSSEIAGVADELDTENLQDGTSGADGEEDEVDHELELEAPERETSSVVDRTGSSSMDMEADGGEVETGVHEGTVAESSTTAGSSEELDAGSGSATEPSLVSQLRKELQDGSVPDEEVEALREEVVGSTVRGGSVDARIQRVEQELGELAAYKDALAAFIDENGSGQEFLEELDDRSRRLASELSTVESTVSEMDDRIDALDDGKADKAVVTEELSTLSDEVADLRTEYESTIAEVEANQQRLDDVVERLTALREEHDRDTETLDAEIERLSEDVREVRSWHRRFSDLFRELSTLDPADEAIAANQDGSPADD